MELHLRTLRQTFFDDLSFALEDAIGDHDFDEFLADLDRRRRDMMARSPNHRQLLTTLRQSATMPWYRLEGSQSPRGS